jgi:hypothetical protein
MPGSRENSIEQVTGRAASEAYLQTLAVTALLVIADFFPSLGVKFKPAVVGGQRTRRSSPAQ